MSDSVLSKHLKVLEGAGYVEATKARGRRTPIPGPRSPVTAAGPDGAHRGTPPHRRPR
ncbi:helix-turn-helix domain-containing protein [Streptomyces cyaneofuscatus]|uniref:helix-turn-helix domain-containing protein n=1 Tax=Streptomyces cyaneofuscatus TaxID=66883 RepID=UPI0033BD89DC